MKESSELTMLLGICCPRRFLQKPIYWNFLAWIGQFQVVGVVTLFFHESVFTSKLIS